MRAIYLEEPGEIVEKEIDRPEIDSDQLLVEIKSVGVCGSDVEYYRSGRIGEFVVEEPLILGHESAGVVAEVGEEVEGFRRGDRVALEPGVPCRKCKYCKSGRYNLCPDVDFMATPPSDGAFVEYYAHPADFAFKLPGSVSLEEGALAEPLSVGIHACSRAEVGLGDRVAILGSGPIGLATLQAALARGASSVTVTDVIPFRLEMARKLGAERAVNAEKESLEEGSFSKVIQTAGTAGTYRQAMEIVERGGKVVQVGHPHSDEVAIDPNLPITREFDLLGSFRYVNTYADAVAMMAAGKVQFEPTISKRFSLGEVEQALRYSSENPDECIKAMVNL